MKAKRDDNGQILIRCPGCSTVHAFDARWRFDGNLERPTFSPSMNARGGHYVDGRAAAECYLCQQGHNFCFVCHSFVTDGRIQFLNDSTHALAGQTVELLEIG